MRKQSKWSLPGVLIFVLAAGTVVHAADSRPGIQKISAAELEQRTIVNRVDHGRQEVERKGDDLVRDANVKLGSMRSLPDSENRIQKIQLSLFQPQNRILRPPDRSLLLYAGGKCHQGC